MSLTAKQLVLEVLSAVQRDRIDLSVRALLRAASVFDIGESSVRVALVRLCADERVVSPRRGHYALGEASGPLHRRVGSWRELPSLLAPWSGAWVGVLTASLPRGNRKARTTRERALRLWGFRELASGLSVRPDNLALGVDGMRERLQELGLEDEALVLRLDELGPRDVDARGLWDGEALDAGYRTMIDELERSAAQLPSMPLADAARESLLLGREAIRRLVLDPLLPAPLVEVEDRERLGEVMGAYDRQGQALWHRYLAIGEEEAA